MRHLSLSLLVLVGGCPAPDPVPSARPFATERVRESCYWVEPDRLADILEAVDRDRLAGVPREEIRASIARACKDERCQDCADAVMAQVFEDPASARPE